MGRQESVAALETPGRSCQAEKQWALSKLQLLMSADTFPHRALLQVLRVNDLVLVPLPWEITLESGNRIRGEVLDTLPASAQLSAPSGSPSAPSTPSNS